LVPAPANLQNPGAILVTRWLIALTLVVAAACTAEPEISTDCLGRPVSVPAPTGTAQLTWEAPSKRTDGSPLNDLAGYRIHYGVMPDQLRCQVEIRDPQVTTWKVTALSPGTWYFAVASFDSGSQESVQSAVVSKQID
jgi:hypothetical protein